MTAKKSGKKTARSVGQTDPAAVASITAAARAARKPRVPVPADESKADKFRRLAVKRANKAKRAIEMLAPLAGSAYEYTPEQAAKIVGALTDAVGLVRAAFAKEKKQTAGIEL